MTERHLKIIHGEGQKEEETTVEINLNGQAVCLTAGNTVKRVIKTGNGIYDHWVYFGGHNGKDAKAFWPEPELQAKLTDMGCITWYDEEPDEEVMRIAGEHFVAEMSGLPISRKLIFIRPSQPKTDPPAPSAA